MRASSAHQGPNVGPIHSTGAPSVGFRRSFGDFLTLSCGPNFGLLLRRAPFFAAQSQWRANCHGRARGDAALYPHPLHLRDRAWVRRTARVRLVGFRRFSGRPLPLSYSPNFLCKCVGPLLSPLRSHQGVCCHRRVVGDATWAHTTTQGPNVDLTRREGALRGVSVLPEIPFLCTAVRTLPCNSAVPLFAPTGPRRVPAITEGPSARKGRRGCDPGPLSTSGTERVSYAKKGYPPWGFAFLPGGPFPCPSIRNLLCNSDGTSFSPTGPSRVPTVTQGPSGTRTGAP